MALDSARFYVQKCVVLGHFTEGSTLDPAALSKWFRWWVGFRSAGIYRKNVTPTRKNGGCEVGGDRDTADTDPVPNYWATSLAGDWTVL